MTVIDGIEIDNTAHVINDIKFAIINNEPIEDKLNVIAVISNPCLYSRRYTLMKEFIKRMEHEDHVNLFIVEMVYENQPFVITSNKNKNHLQVTTKTPLWHKENMVNLGVKQLLPKNYKAFAWIDADIEFENSEWATDTLKILNGCKDVVQLFSHCVDLNHNKNTLNIFNGFGYSFCKGKKYIKTGIDYWHSGYAWAITRKAYEKLGGLYDKGVLGSGDSIMALALINKCDYMTRDDYSEDYNDSMLEYQKKARKIRLGYTPGVIRHYFHGTKQKRNYTNRWNILMNHKFSPYTDIGYDEQGIIIPKQMSSEFIDDILNYFKERKEDDDI